MTRPANDSSVVNAAKSAQSLVGNGVRLVRAVLRNAGNEPSLRQRMSGKTTPHLHMTSPSLTTTVDTIRTGLTMTRMRTTSQPARPRRSSPSRSAKTKPKKKNRKASRSDDGGRFSFTSPLVWLGFPFAATFATIAALFIVPGVGVILAIIVLIVGLILMGIGGIRLLIGAFQEDVVCGLLYLFVPFYSLYYLVTR